MTVSNKKHMCHCNAFGMAHKRNEICKEFQRRMDKLGIESQKHILKEWDKKRGLK